MNGRFIWVTSEQRDKLADFMDELEITDVELPKYISRARSIVAAWDAATDDPVAACLIAAARYRRGVWGDAESATESVALMLRELGMPYPAADWRDA